MKTQFTLTVQQTLFEPEFTGTLTIRFEDGKEGKDFEFIFSEELRGWTAGRYPENFMQLIEIHYHGQVFLRVYGKVSKTLPDLTDVQNAVLQAFRTLFSRAQEEIIKRFPFEENRWGRGKTIKHTVAEEIVLQSHEPALVGLRGIESNKNWEIAQPKVMAMVCPQCEKHFWRTWVGEPILGMCDYHSEVTLIPRRVNPKKVKNETNDLSWMTVMRNDFSRSGCFITSACVIARGLPDDCFELTTLRQFRGTYVTSLPTGQEDIREYCTYAPLIVKAIGKNENAYSIFCSLYDSMIAPSVALIVQGQYAQAYELYKQQFCELRQRFLLSMFKS